MGELFVKTSRSNVPWWVDFLDPLSTDDIRVPSSRTTSAVLALQLEMGDKITRTVCFTFGYGRHLIDPLRIERFFGLKVTLNSVDPTRLRGFDTRRHDDIVVNSRIQSSTQTGIAAFNIDTYRDILTNAVGSTPRGWCEEDQVTLIRGSDGVSFDIRTDPVRLADIAHRLLGIYKLENYKEQFGFVDHILPVDLTRADELDRKLAWELNTRMVDGTKKFRCLYLAPPEVLDFERLEGFVFSSERGRDKTSHSELLLADYFDTRRNLKSGLDIDVTRQDRVLLRHEGTVDQRLSSVYRCLIAETELGDTTFQLVDGRWYEIDRSFVTRIRQELSTIPTATIEFPDHIQGEEEQYYNLRVANMLPNALLMDRKNVQLGGGSNRIEFCDIALSDCTLIHAKKRSSSSTLSHLWAQGTVAMEALLGDSEFRAAVRQEGLSARPDLQEHRC